MSESASENPLCLIKYRPQVKKAFFVVVGLSFLSLLIIFRLRADEIGGQDWYKALITFVLAASVPLTLLIKSLIVFRPKIFCQYEVYRNRIVRKWGKSRHEIKFSDLVMVKFSKFSPRFFGGFSIQGKSGVELRFPSLVENCSELVKSVSAARPDLVPQDKLNMFLNLNSALEISWGRIREKVLNWKFWMPKYVLAPVIIAGVLSSYSLDAVTWFFISVAYAYTVAFFLNLLEERVWLKKMSQMANLERDFEFEKHLSWGIDIFYYVSISLVTLGLVKVSAAIL